VAYGKEKGIEITELIDHLGDRFAHAMASRGIHPEQNRIVPGAGGLQGGGKFHRVQGDDAVISECASTGDSTYSDLPWTQCLVPGTDYKKKSRVIMLPGNACKHTPHEHFLTILPGIKVTNVDLLLITPVARKSICQQGPIVTEDVIGDGDRPICAPYIGV
jgi:hypothetical protein